MTFLGGDLDSSCMMAMGKEVRALQVGVVAGYVWGGELCYGAGGQECV